jgi:hypothetical protein
MTMKMENMWLLLPHDLISFRVESESAFPGVVELLSSLKSPSTLYASRRKSLDRSRGSSLTALPFSFWAFHRSMPFKESEDLLLGSGLTNELVRPAIRLEVARHDLNGSLRGSKYQITKHARRS